MKCSHYGCQQPAAPLTSTCKAHLVKDLRSEGYRITDEQATTMTVQQLLDFVEMFESEVSA